MIRIFLCGLMVVGGLLFAGEAATPDVIKGRQLHFLKLVPKREFGQVRIQFEAQKVLPRELMPDFYLDSTIWRATQLCRQVMDDEQNLVFSYIELLTFNVKLSIHDMNGKLVSQSRKRLRLDIDPNTATVYYATHLPQPSKRNMHKVRLDDLSDETKYAEFLADFFYPFSEDLHNIPDNGNYVVSLQYQLPRVVEKKYANSVFLWHMEEGYPYTLGVSYVPGDEDNVHHSNHLVNVHDLVGRLDKAWQLASDKQYVESLPMMEAAFAEMPSNAQTARALWHLYHQLDMGPKKIDLLRGFQPIFLSFYPNQITSRKIMAEERDSFVEDPHLWLKITSPIQDDLVAGRCRVDFVVKDHNALAYRFELHQDGEVVDLTETYPTHMYFEPKGHGQTEIEVIGYFADRTRVSDRIQVNTLAVDEKQEVNLVRLQVVAVKGNGEPLTDLDVSDFTVRENGEVMKLAGLERLEQPLNIGVLVDISGSMYLRDRLHHARHATEMLLSKMGPRESSAVYSFDNRVLRIKRYDQGMNEFKPVLHTMMPQLGTSLRDALLIARCDLLKKREETNALIILSDGRDSSSVTSTRQIEALMADTPIRVYTINLHQGSDGMMDRMPKRSGGTSRRVSRSSGLDKHFTKVLDELREVYEVTYYSSRPTEESKISVKVKGGKARWLNLN